MPFPITIYTEEADSKLAKEDMLFLIISSKRNNQEKFAEIRRLLGENNIDLKRLHGLTNQSIMIYAASYGLTASMMRELQQKGVDVDVNLTDGLTPLDYYQKPSSSIIDNEARDQERYIYAEIENRIKNFLNRELTELENAKLALFLLSLVRYALTRNLNPELTETHKQYLNLAKDIVDKHLIGSKYQALILFHFSLVSTLQKQTDEAHKYLNLAKQIYEQLKLQHQAADVSYTVGIVLHYTDSETTIYLATLRCFRFASQSCLDSGRQEDALECIRRFYTTCFLNFSSRKRDGYEDLIAIVSSFELKNVASTLHEYAKEIMLAYAHNEQYQLAIKWCEIGYEKSKYLLGCNGNNFFVANCAHLAITLNQIEQAEKWCSILIELYKKEYKDKGYEINHFDSKWTYVRGKNNEKYKTVFQDHDEVDVMLDQLFKYMTEMTNKRDSHGSKNCDRWRLLIDKISSTVGKENLTANSYTPVVRINERHLLWQDPKNDSQCAINSASGRLDDHHAVITVINKSDAFIREGSSSGRSSKR